MTLPARWQMAEFTARDRIDGPVVMNVIEEVIEPPRRSDWRDRPGPRAPGAARLWCIVEIRAERRHVLDALL
jgi:hypothetical protein